MSTPAPGISLERDAKGRIIRRVLNLGQEPETRRYAYDAAGRLARVTDGGGALCESYQYDHEGRRLADINPQRVPFGGWRGERRYAYAAGNRLSQAGQAQFRHDAAGFRSLKLDGEAETRYRYEPSGLLLAVDLPGDTLRGRRIEYAYDSSGMRREKRVGGRLVAAYRWLDPLRLLEFFDGNEWWRLAYDGTRRAPVGLTNGSASYLILSDHLGTPLALADMDGNVVQTMRYDTFGNLLETRGHAVRLPIGFAGGLFDADTSLTRFVWRDYDADTGRFTALDPLGAKGGDSDWYGYCVDDPVNRVDAWGLFSWKDVESAFSPTVGNLASAAPTAATKMAERAALIGSGLATGLTVLTAPLGDLISPDSVSDVEEETKEYWDKRNAPYEPEDMRGRH